MSNSIIGMAAAVGLCAVAAAVGLSSLTEEVAGNAPRPENAVGAQPRPEPPPAAVERPPEVPETPEAKHAVPAAPPMRARTSQPAARGLPAAEREQLEAIARARSELTDRVMSDERLAKELAKLKDVLAR